MPTPHTYVAADGSRTWRVRFRIGKRNTSETFHEEREAHEFCRDVSELGAARAVARLEERAVRGREPSLTAVFREFVEWKAPRVRSDRTIADYERDWENWIAPTFGHRIAALITKDDVQDWVDRLVDGRTVGPRGRAGTKSIKDRHALLHAVFAFAIRKRYLVGNPCEVTELPKKMPAPPKGLRPAEWQALAVALRQINEDAADLADFLLASGWRWSEATALDTFSVEDDGERMWVSVGHVMRRNAAGQVVRVEDVKGAGSLRRIELDPGAASMVRRRLLTCHPGDLVFRTGVASNGLGGSQWRYSNFVSRYWDPAVKAANLGRRPTPHWLRHTAVFWLALSGAKLPELQSRIGHKSISTTINVYGRMLTDVEPAALDRFAAMRGDGQGRALPAVTGQAVD